jgi:hypothetical protein
MRDDFKALDLLSADTFHWSSDDSKPKKKKKALFGLPRRKAKGKKAKRSLTNLLPAIAAKVKHPRGSDRLLQGWPVALSWPDDKSTEIH